MGTKRPSVCGWVTLVALLLLSASALAASKQCKYSASPHASVNIVNRSGKITVTSSPGRQVTISANPSSDNVEVDCSQVGGRIEAMSHFLQQNGDKNGRVDYEVHVPTDTNVFIREADGPIEVSGLSSDLSLRSDASEIHVSNLKNAHLHVVTINGRVTLDDVNGGVVDVLSTSGKVRLTKVAGPKVTVSTTTGEINYSGDFGSGGVYSFIDHSGNIDVSLPATASVDIDARALHGHVENDFPLQQNTHLANSLVPGRAFRGTSNAGSSSVELRSFSGTIRVRKQ